MLQNKGDWPWVSLNNASVRLEWHLKGILDLSMKKKKKKSIFIQILVDGPKKKIKKGKFVFDHRCTTYLACNESI